jgi:hypothetical protein
LELPNGFASISSPKSRTREGWDALLNLLARSTLAQNFLRLDTLAFKAIGMDEDTIIRALASPAFTSLKALTVMSKVSDCFVRALTLPACLGDRDVLGILPQLEDLNLEICASSDGLLSHLILSRGASLKRVRATMSGSDSDCFAQDLALRAPGVDIIF